MVDTNSEEYQILLAQLLSFGIELTAAEKALQATSAVSLDAALNHVCSTSEQYRPPEADPQVPIAPKMDYNPFEASPFQTSIVEQQEQKGQVSAKSAKKIVPQKRRYISTGPSSPELDSQYSKNRHEFFRTDEHASPYHSEGEIIQINTLDQFHKTWCPLIQEFNFPKAACGAFAIANSTLAAQFISTLPEKAITTWEQVLELNAMLKNIQIMKQELRKVMQFINSNRTNEVKKFKIGAKTRIKSYLSDWVANYEISDCILNAVQTSKVGLTFLRHNQYPIIHKAKFEELERLQEEQPFGGKTIGKDIVKFEEGDSRYIVERFSPKRVLQRPEEWMIHEADQNAAKKSIVYILDLNGHFVTAVSAMIEGVRNLIVHNTTDGAYIEVEIFAAAFDFAFPAM